MTLRHALALNLLGLCLLTTETRATTYARETFDTYANGNLGTQNGGTGWTSAWAPVTSPTVATNSTFVVNSGVAQTNGNDLDTALYMRRGLTVPGASTTTYYLRYDYMVPTKAGGEGSIYGGVSLGQDGRQTGSDITIFSQDWPGGSQAYHLRIKLGPNGSISNNIGSPGNAGTTLLYDHTYVVLARIEPGFTAGNTRVTIWLDPTSELDTPHLQATTGTVSIPSGFLPGTSQNLGLYRESANSTTISYDNIRVANNFLEALAVPEPASAGLFAGAAALFSGRRWKR